MIFSLSGDNLPVGGVPECCEGNLISFFVSFVVSAVFPQNFPHFFPLSSLHQLQGKISREHSFLLEGIHVLWGFFCRFLQNGVRSELSFKLSYQESPTTFIWNPWKRNDSKNMACGLRIPKVTKITKKHDVRSKLFSSRNQKILKEAKNLTKNSDNFSLKFANLAILAKLQQK